MNLKNLNEVLKVISFPHFQNRISGLTDVKCRTEEVLAMRKGTDALGFDRQPIYDEVKKNTFMFSRVLGSRVHHPFQRPLTHLCDLEAGVYVEIGSKLGGAAQGLERQTSYMQLRGRTYYAAGAERMSIPNFL